MWVPSSLRLPPPVKLGIEQIMHSTPLRDFQPTDTGAINALGVAAFEQFASHYEDWPAFKAKIACMSSLAETGEIIVATSGDAIVGAVAYLGPTAPKSTFFPGSWAVMRMLVVCPQARGRGVGRALANGCIAKARRDGAAVFGLHTSPIMSVALAMYQTMGFEFQRDAPPIHGVPYGIYAMQLAGPGRVA
jgi:ribosomal protein S18 acetylase RimI-like enzyme